MHDAVSLDGLHTPAQFVLAVLWIVWIDIVLAGDNAVVIALAVRTLPQRQRLWGTILGAGVAVLLRVALTAIAAQLMNLGFVKLVGGGLILWIGVKLLAQEDAGGHEGRTAGSLAQAVWMIMIADVTMSLDNVLAVAGASKNHLGLLLFGLGLSIPLVVFTSNLLSRLMDRFPVIVYIGAAILGKVGGEMMLTDGWVTRQAPVPGWAVYLAEAVGAVGVIAVALLLRRRRAAK